MATVECAMRPVRPLIPLEVLVAAMVEPAMPVVLEVSNH